MSDDLEDRIALTYRNCGHGLSPTDRSCPSCGTMVITERRAKFFMSVSGLFSIVLVFEAAVTTLEPAGGIFVPVLLLGFALFSAFWAFIGYELLRKRQKQLADIGVY